MRAEATRRPKKKKEVGFIEDNTNKDDAYNNGYDRGNVNGYNKACDDWGAFLPSATEIENTAYKIGKGKIPTYKFAELAEAISKRLKGEK